MTIEPIAAPGLLGPADLAENRSSSFRLDSGLDPARGQRARLSVELGNATVFAITGRLDRRGAARGPLDPGHAKALGLQRADSGKVYGAGVTRNVRGVDLSATYQYSKVSAEQPVDDGRWRDGGPGKSHSLRAAARIRFRP